MGLTFGSWYTEKKNQTHPVISVCIFKLQMQMNEITQTVIPDVILEVLNLPEDYT